MTTIYEKDYPCPNCGGRVHGNYRHEVCAERCGYEADPREDANDD